MPYLHRIDSKQGFYFYTGFIKHVLPERNCWMHMHIEVFKTNVERAEEAERIITAIHKSFDGYRANFDLQDCDRILRIKSEKGGIENEKLIALVNNLGYKAGVLPDN